MTRNTTKMIHIGWEKQTPGAGVRYRVDVTASKTDLQSLIDGVLVYGGYYEVESLEEVEPARPYRSTYGEPKYTDPVYHLVVVVTHYNRHLAEGQMKMVRNGLGGTVELLP